MHWEVCARVEATALALTCIGMPRSNRIYDKSCANDCASNTVGASTIFNVCSNIENNTAMVA